LATPVACPSQAPPATPFLAQLIVMAALALKIEAVVTLSQTNYTSLWLAPSLDSKLSYSQPKFAPSAFTVNFFLADLYLSYMVSFKI
jgi:hypothetical protein